MLDLNIRKNRILVDNCYFSIIIPLEENWQILVLSN